jgi:hypothetical protein
MLNPKEVMLKTISSVERWKKHKLSLSASSGEFATCGEI